MSSLMYQELLAKDLASVDHVIRQNLYSEVVLIRQISEYIVNAGGKRIRPVLALLFARAHQLPELRLDNAYLLAAIVECIHTATLLHDDVVDESSLRRGQKTVNALFGNASSVLAGDFLYSRAFQMMVQVDSMSIMRILADATNVIAEGEVLQLLNISNANMTESDYLGVIRSKTAKLFEASAQVGAMIANASAAEVLSAGAFGCALGEAFQLIDDALDYSGQVDEIGKNIGDDLREGKVTLPVIYLLQNGSAQEREMLQQIIADPKPESCAAVIKLVNSSKALEYTFAKAQQAVNTAKQALSDIKPSAFKKAMIELADFVVQRKN